LLRLCLPFRDARSLEFLNPALEPVHVYLSESIGQRTRTNTNDQDFCRFIQIKRTTAFGTPRFQRVSSTASIPAFGRPVSRLIVVSHGPASSLERVQVEFLDTIDPHSLLGRSGKTLKRPRPPNGYFILDLRAAQHDTGLDRKLRILRTRLHG
jgi:hypothetical protein